MVLTELWRGGYTPFISARPAQNTMTRRTLFQMLAGLPVVGKLAAKPAPGREIAAAIACGAKEFRAARMMEDYRPMVATTFRGLGLLPIKREGQPWSDDDEVVNYCRAVFDSPFDA